MLHFSPRLLRRYVLIVIASLTLALLARSLWSGIFGRKSSLTPYYVDMVMPEGEALPPDSACSADLKYLRRKQYGLTAEVIYRKRCIWANQQDTVQRFEVANITEPLVQGGDVLQKRTDCEGWAAPTMSQSLACDGHLEIDVPPPFPQQDYGHILFGVATTFERLKLSLPQFTHWLGRSGATLVAVVIDAEEMEGRAEYLTEEYRKQGVNIVLEHPWDPSITVNKQHFALVLNLVRHVTSQTEWVSIIDDDTFFPSLYPLSQKLREYDSKKPAYLGGMSESHSAVKSHGIMAYGGAGIFLSIPLLTELHPLVHDCLKEKLVRHGDSLLSICVGKMTRTEFTVIPGLQQLDMHGDISGFYESGQLPLSLHHWKSWHDAPVHKMAKVAHFCGGCFLQRWRLDSDTVLTNGYSIVVYSEGTEHLSLDEMEGTWENAGNGQWSFGPMRPAVANSLKKSYLLLDSEQVGSSLRQLYIHRADIRGHPSRADLNADRYRDEIIELWWEW